METRGRKKEREGEWMQREGASLTHCKGKCCSRGSSGGLLPCQIYTAAQPPSVLAPARNGGEAQAQRGRMGQEVLLMSRVQAPRNHQTQRERETQHLPLLAAP